MKHGKTLSVIAMVLLLVGLMVSPVMAQSPPQLSEPSVSPSSGTSSFDFCYRVKYHDPDGDVPVVAQVYIDDVAHTMNFESGSPENGIYRCVASNLFIGNHSYYFHFEDATGGEARLPETGNFSGPLVYPTYAQNNPPVATGLASLGTNLVIAWGYKADEGGWTFYNPLLPEISTLTTLQVQRGYWINVDAYCDLEYGARVYPLEAGWNLIGWAGW